MNVRITSLMSHAQTGHVSCRSCATHSRQQTMWPHGTSIALQRAVKHTLHVCSASDRGSHRGFETEAVSGVAEEFDSAAGVPSAGGALSPGWAPSAGGAPSPAAARRAADLRRCIRHLRSVIRLNSASSIFAQNRRHVGASMRRNQRKRIRRSSSICRSCSGWSAEAAAWWMRSSARRSRSSPNLLLSLLLSLHIRCTASAHAAGKSHQLPTSLTRSLAASEADAAWAEV